MNNRKLFQALKRTAGRLMLAENDGHLWATNSYWLVRVDSDSPVRSLLADYNLPVEPMVCDVDHTIRRNDADPPTLAHLIPKKRPTTVIERHTHESMPLYVDGIAGTKTGLWAIGETSTIIGINEAHKELAESLVKVVHWLGDPARPHAPLVGINGDDEFAGLLMPVRLW